MFDRTLAREIVNEAEAVLNEHFKERDIRFERGNASFNPESCKFRLTAIAPGADPGKNDFERHCRRFGLDPDHLGQTFTYCGKAYQIKGLNPKAPKYPVIAKQAATGKSYRFNAEDVASLLRGQAS